VIVVMDIRLRTLVAALWIAVLAPATLYTQQREAPRSARAAANIDLTGYWVSFVTEDWRFRMVTPPQGDYTGVPLNAEGLRVAETWTWEKERAAGEPCRAYGAPTLMRRPTRLRISWRDDQALAVETDAGTQTRVLTFGRNAVAPRGRRTWQGVSSAAWEDTTIPASGLAILTMPPPPPSHALKVTTTGLRPGYLRANGVPYSERTVMTEYFDTFTHRGGQEWLVITTVVDDPTYLQQPFITTTHFKKEADGSRWQPTPCAIEPPTRGPRPVPPTGYRAQQPRS
jgi:hypothetical protein